MATYVCVVEPFARVHVTVVDELKAYPEEMLKQRGDQWLTASELSSWESMQAKQTRRMEWLYGRIALKEAVIAWMRHQTTAYDSMKIARVKGQRREVRRMLAARSRSVLEAYRQGHTIPDSCPLKRSLETE